MSTETKQLRYFPTEIHRMIIDILLKDPQINVPPLASVSSMWQAYVEEHTFNKIRLTPDRLFEWDHIIQRYNRFSHVHYIWFCIETLDYDCHTCQTVDQVPMPLVDRVGGYRLKNGIYRLFWSLSKFPPHWKGHESTEGRKTEGQYMELEERHELWLDISIFSPSDTEHWFKYLVPMPDSYPVDMVKFTSALVACDTDDPRHHWWANQRKGNPPLPAIFNASKLVLGVPATYPDFGQMMDWIQTLPAVPAITGFLLRQDTRRIMCKQSLGHVLQRLTGLRAVHVEDWAWNGEGFATEVESFIRSLQFCVDAESEDKSVKLRRDPLERLVFYTNYASTYQSDGIASSHFQVMMYILADISRTLSHLNLSLLVEAGDLIAEMVKQDGFEFPHLKSLIMTDTDFTQKQADSHTMVNDVIRDAALVLRKMPKLEIMEIWCGQSNQAGSQAALFQFQRTFPQVEPDRALFRGTFMFSFRADTMKRWRQASGALGNRNGCSFETEFIETTGHEIFSYSDALLYLQPIQLPMRPLSYFQLRMYQDVFRGRIRPLFWSYEECQLAIRQVMGVERATYKYKYHPYQFKY